MQQSKSFKAFLVESERSIAIDEEDVLSLLENECSDIDFSERPRVVRAVNYKDPYVVVDPKRGQPRKSANTSNYYTEIIDNSKAWAKYPKRSQSLICSTTQLLRDAPRNARYIVIPFNGSKWGLCEDVDFWYGFKKSPAAELDDFNKSIQYLCNGVLEDSLGYRFDSDFASIKKRFEEVDAVLKDYDRKSMPDFFEAVLPTKSPTVSEYFLDWFVRFYKGNMLELIEKTLNPDLNNFELCSYDELPTNKAHEVWTDSKAILIDIKKYEDLFKKL